MSDYNLLIWDNLKQVPAACVGKISGGRLSGMSDIKPQWRLQAMTHQFGVCGIGWKYVVTKKWLEDGSEAQKVAFVDIDLFIKVDGEWSDAIPGTGGSLLIAKEKTKLYTSDEAYKMATTDALGVAMKAIGVAADIYMGAWDGSKYADTSGATKPPVDPEKKKIDNLKSTILGLMDEKELGSNEKRQLIKFYCNSNKHDFEQLEKMDIKTLKHFISDFETTFSSMIDSIGK